MRRAILLIMPLVTTEIYTLSLHDALPISHIDRGLFRQPVGRGYGGVAPQGATARSARRPVPRSRLRVRADRRGARHRSEEHTSELQSQSNLVCRLLLEKKNTNLPRNFLDL